MKIIKPLTVTVLTLSLLSVPLVGFAADQKTESKAKPYQLKTCVVSGEKFGEMDPYVFVYKDREIKLCCKDCLKDFNKAPAKYVKKIEEAEAKAKKSQ